MKKLLIVLLALVAALALVACGGPSDETLPTDDETTPSDDHIHAYEEVITPATCTTVGKIESKCPCGDVQSSTELPIADHIASVLDCDKDTVCTVCNAVLAESTGHTIVSTEVVTAATCTSVGKEKGACITCGKIVEKEISTSGHTFDTSSAWTVSGGNYASTCTTCKQNVTLTAQDPIISLTFEEDLDAEIAKYPVFRKFGNGGVIDDTDGDKALKVTYMYLDVVDNKAMHDLGTFVVTFDVMTTAEAAAGTEASVFSILSNFAEGKDNVGGTTDWGFAFKLHEGADKFETIIARTDLSKHNDSNSLSVVRNQKYNVQLIYAEGRFTVYIDGKCLGLNNGANAVPSFDSATKFSFRFVDGPNPGLVFDNFAISALR